MDKVTIAINPHWYSRFWMRQFWQLARQGKIKLYPHLRKSSPPACFYFEVNGLPYLIDVTDSKDLAYDPTQYGVYFKANYDPGRLYPVNVVSSLNGTTLTKHNFPLPEERRVYDIVWLAGISGGRPHKVAMFLALASLPFKMKLAARMVSSDDHERWGALLQEAGVEVWKDNVPYQKWLEWNRQARWNVLNRGKHDCLSFKMVDYMSIGGAVIADYPPTSYWPVPVREKVHYMSLGLSGPMDNNLSSAEFLKLCSEYKEKAKQLLPVLKNENLRKEISKNNLKYFAQHIQNGAAAAYILGKIREMIPETMVVK